jgi:hypothetical protein
MKNKFLSLSFGLLCLFGCDTKKIPLPNKKTPSTTANNATSNPSPPKKSPKTEPVVASSLTNLPADPLLRERAEVTINGVKEQWSLRWDTPPKPFCEYPEDAMTCPCAGFGYGETGKLSLIREREGMPKEKLLLDPMFDGGFNPSEASILQKYEYIDADGDLTSEQFQESITKRKPASILQLKDYNGDGLAAEFVLQVGAGPCGHRQGVLLGVDARGGPIRVFGTKTNPAAPLSLEMKTWDSFLFKNSFDSVEFGCGDHGSEDETVLHLSAKDGEFNAVEERFDCSGKGGTRGKSIFKGEL